MAVLRGEGTDYLPFIPRLDLWYKSNKLMGTLPKKYKYATLTEIVEDMDIGYHAVVPDFKDVVSIEDEADRALGIYNLRTMPYRTILENVERKITYEGDITKVEYTTPYGNIVTKTLYNDVMRKAGITITHVLEYPIKSVHDFEAVAYIFDNLNVIPCQEEYRQFKETVGNRGVAVGFACQTASPMHMIQKELMPVDQFFYTMADHPQELEWLSEQLNRYFTRVFDVVSRCDAEIIFSGANYDSSITYPPFFEKYIAPYLAKQAELCHANGKYLLTHTDGENHGLLELYLKANIDIADSICPYPMTKETLQEVRQVFQSQITVWGGLPSICVLEDSMTEYEFDKYIHHTLESIGKGDRLIIALADTTPPSAKFKRIVKIAKACRDFGPIKPDSLAVLKVNKNA